MKMYKDSIIKKFEKAYYDGDGQDEEFLEMSIDEAIKDWSSHNYGGAEYEVAVEYLNEHFNIYEEEAE